MISIIIPTWNQNELTRECVLAVRETTKDCEIILVDNGSDPPLPKIHAGFVDVTLIRNETNLGFPAAVNQGVSRARGDVVVLLNNDVIVTPGWANGLLHHLERFAIVGPLTNYCAGVQRAFLPAYENKEELFRVAMEWHEENCGAELPVNWIIGFCFAFHRSLFDVLGPFDESMWPSSGEEIDFCLRARYRKYEVGVARDVYVHHEGSVTFRDMHDKGIVDYGGLCEATTENLKRKWSHDFWKRQHVEAENGSGLRINLGCGMFPLQGFVNIDREESVKPDVVADVTDLPYDPDTVDEIYAGHLLEHFDWLDGERLLRYWFELLKPGGKIAVTVPDFDVVAERYLKNPTPDNLRELNDTYIYSHRQKSPHQYAYSAALLREAMEKTGFTELKRMPVDHPYFPAAVDWQVGYSAVKPCG